MLSAVFPDWESERNGGAYEVPVLLSLSITVTFTLCFMGLIIDENPESDRISVYCCYCRMKK